LENINLIFLSAKNLNIIINNSICQICFFFAWLHWWEI